MVTSSSQSKIDTITKYQKLEPLRSVLKTSPKEMEDQFKHLSTKPPLDKF